MLNNTSLVCYGTQKLLLAKNKQPSPISSTLLVCISIPAAIATTFGNILILYTLYVTPSLHTAGNVLIAALAISDVFVGLVALPINAVLRVLSIYGIHVCWLKMAFALSICTGTGVSMMNAAVISIDRCIAVLLTKAYRKWYLQTTYKVLLLGLWLAWILFLVLVAAKIVPDKSFRVGVVAGTIMCILIVVVCYVLISIKISKEKKCISNLVLGSINTEDAKQKKRLYTISMILLILIICYLPKTFCLVFSGLLGNRADIAYQCGNWPEMLMLLNSGFNPFIYCKRIDNIRTEVVKNLRKLLRMKAQGPVA